MNPRLRRARIQLHLADFTALASFCEDIAAQSRRSAQQSTADQLACCFQEHANQFTRYATSLRELVARGNVRALARDNR